MDKKIYERNKEEKNKKDAIKDLSFEKILTKRNELDDINDLWYFVKSRKNRWIMGSAH